VRSKHALVFKTELYTEICTRSSAKHAFHASYPVIVGLPNSPLDEAGSNANAAQQRTHTGCVTKLVWADSVTVPPQLAEKVCGVAYIFCALFLSNLDGAWDSARWQD
jgi:hypothetical protein